MAIAYGHWGPYPCHPKWVLTFRVGGDGPDPCPECGGEASFVKDGEGTIEELVERGIIPPQT